MRDALGNSSKLVICLLAIIGDQSKSKRILLYTEILKFNTFSDVFLCIMADRVERIHQHVTAPPLVNKFLTAKVSCL